MRVVHHRLKCLPKWSRNDDCVDVLSHRLTVFPFVLLAIFVFVMQLVVGSMNCAMPAHMTTADVTYFHSHCWAHAANMYGGRRSDENTEDSIPRPAQQVSLSYIHWVPVILLVQAFLFYLPHAAWKRLSRSAGIDLQSLAENARLLTSNVDEKPETRAERLTGVATAINRFLRSHYIMYSGPNWLLRIISDILFCNISKRSYYLVISYLVVKLLYVINAIVQLFLVDAALGMSFHEYGIDVIRGVVHRDQDWPTVASPYFPRLTQCAVNLRKLGQVQSFEFQCNIPINAYNDKIFLFVWFWLIFVICLSQYNVIAWIVRLVMFPCRRALLFSRLERPHEALEKQQLWKRFVNDFVSLDGSFVLLMLEQNSDAVAVTEVVQKMWDDFVQQREVQEVQISDKLRGENEYLAV